MTLDRALELAVRLLHEEARMYGQEQYAEAAKMLEDLRSSSLIRAFRIRRIK